MTYCPSTNIFVWICKTVPQKRVTALWDQSLNYTLYKKLILYKFCKEPKGSGVKNLVFLNSGIITINIKKD